MTTSLLPSEALYRFNPGFLIATFGMAGRSAAGAIWVSYRDRRRLLEEPICRLYTITMYLLISSLAVIAIVGVGAWFVGWNGKNTRTAYGLGVFVCVVGYEWSVGRYVDQTIIDSAPPVAQLVIKSGP